MAEYTYIGGNKNTLKTLLESSGYFDSVTIDDVSYSAGGVTGTYNGASCKIDDVLVLHIGAYYTSIGGGSYVDAWSVFINQSQITHFEYGNTTDGSYQYNVYRPQKAYKTQNGILIVCDTGRILITKNQNGKVVVACGAYKPTGNQWNESEYVMGKIAAIAVTDDVPFVEHEIDTSNLASQTLTVPICTCSSTPSYTDKAGVFEYRQYDVIGNFQHDNKRYFTDGYFVIEDPETN